MTDKKISALDAAGTLTGAEMVPVVQSSTTKRTTAQAIANLAAVAIPDPLELGAAVFANYVAVGTDPPASGAVRLTEDGHIVAQAADVGQTVGDVPVIGLKRYASGADHFAAIQMGGNGALASNKDFVFDPYWNTVLFSSMELAIQSGLYDPDTLFTAQSARFMRNGMIAKDSEGTNAIQLILTNPNPAGLEALLQIKGLPTSDPGVGSFVWADAGVLKITAAS